MIFDTLYRIYRKAIIGFVYTESHRFIVDKFWEELEHFLKSNMSNLDATSVKIVLSDEDIFQTTDDTAFDIPEDIITGWVDYTTIRYVMYFYNEYTKYESVRKAVKMYLEEIYEQFKKLVFEEL